VDEFNSRFVTGEDSEARRARTRRSTTARPQRRSRRTETNVVLIALAAIAIFTVVVIAAWKTGGSPSTPPPTTAKKHVRVPPALFTFTALHGTTHVIARNASATGAIRYDGTVQKGDSSVAIRGKRLWVAIDSPENLRLLVRGKRVHVPGLRPRVIIVTSTGWRPA
jgi:hypothetical protein